MEYSTYSRFLILILLIGAPFRSPVFGQESSSDSTDFAFLPAIAYNSDQGLIFGGISNIYKYKDDTHPFYSYTIISGLISTKGLANFGIFYDKPHAFGKELRLTSALYGGRFFQDVFYGVGNYQKVTDPPAGSPNYFLFKSFSLGLETLGRFPIKKTDSNKQLDAFLSLDLIYETPWDNGSDRLITLEQPLGINGGRTFLLGTGIVWEGRNNEFLPTHGNYGTISLKTGQTFWGSDFANAELFYDFRQYLSFHLIKDVTFATRFTGTHTYGDVPYWRKPYAGDGETLRGFVYRRFLDDNVNIMNNELRTWLFDFPKATTKLGGTLFFDAGRTYPNGSSLNQITSDIKYTVGFGGLLSVFTPEFIIRGDFGFSEEGMGVYFNIGYMF